MELHVTLQQWAAWAPGIEDHERWQAWAASPWLPGASGAPDLPEVPALQRRRLSPLGRAAYKVARGVRGATAMPAVFASRYGDVDRSLAAIEAMLKGQEPSPAAFAGSVHNAVAAQCAIIDQWTDNLVCVAAGRCSAAAGLVEAAGLLAEGASQVLLVCYDEPLPTPYDAFTDQPQAVYAWAWRLGAATTDGARLSLALTDPPPVGEAPAPLPADLDVLRWWIAGPATLQQRDGARTWVWSRHG